MAGFTEWSNNRKKELGTSTATTQSSKAKSFTEWSNEKNNITTPQTYRNHNTAFESSGKSRDEYDSSVRQNYAARAAASEPALKTSGGYYSQPTIGADLERYGNTVSTYESALQDKVKKLETANDELERLNGELTVAGAKMESLHAYTKNSTIATGLFNQAQQDYLDLLGQYEEATKAAEAAYNEYQPAYQKYTEAVNAYETYRTEQQGIYDSWRGTIRDADAITQEMASVDAQIEQLEQQQKELNAEATQLMNKVSQRRVGYNEMAGISQQAQEKRQQANALQAEIDALGEMKTLLAEEKDWAEYFSWEDYRSAEDFADRSKYVSTYQPGTEEFNAWSGTYTNTGFGDINYDYINRNETALGRQNVNDTSLNLSFLGLDDSERQEMTDEEIAMFNYLYALDTERGDAEHSTAYAYIDYLTSDLNYRQRKKAEEDWASYAAESPVGSSAFSVLTSPLKGLSYLGQFADYAEDGEIDQNEGYNKFSYMNTAIRNEVSDTIEKSGNWGSVGSFAYNTGMSMADFLFNTAITGGFAGGGSISSAMALGIMGTGAAADTVISAKDRGLDDGQAFALGTIAGAAEVLTEKFSLDALLKGRWEESAIKYILKNAVTEGSEEVGADVINTMADILIAKDQSQWQAAIDAYVAQGKSESEAFGLALADQAIQMGLSFAGGFLSGGTIGGTYAGIGTLSQNAAYKQTGASLRKMGDEMLQAIIDTGLQAEENTEAHKMALELQEKMKSGTVTDAEIGRLFSLAAKEANAENATTTPEEGIVLPEAGQETAQQTEQENIGEPLEAVLPTGELQETAEEPARAELPAQEQSELMRTAAMYGIERETVERVQRIADIVHRNIVFYDSAREGENGYRDRATNTLYINARSQNPVAQIISHELTHSLEETGSYADFQTLVLNRIQQTTGDLEQRRRNKAELYASKGVQLETQAEIDQEIVAEYVEKNLLTDEASIRAIVQQNRSVGQRIVRWLNDLIAKLGNRDAQQRAFLTRARDLYATALQESQSSFTAETARSDAPQQAELPVIRAEETATGAGETVIRSGETVTEDGESVVDPADTESDQYLIALREQLANGEITEQEYDRLFDEYYEGGSENQYSFGGRNANTADLDALRRAQEMERQGVAAETIFRETGWYTGADGKWRFEIDDSGMEYNPRREEDGAVPGQTLADFLKHDELFRSYPQLRKTRLEFADLGRGINGQYNAETDTITLSNELRDAPEGTLIHEIQHAIQRAEGFASGANTKFWERQLESGYDGRTQQQRREVQRLWQEYNSIRDNEPDFFAAMVGLEAMAPDVPRGEINWDTLEKIEEDPIEWQRYDAAREELEKQYGDIRVWDFIDLRYKLKQLEMNTGRTAADLYYDTAGEIEARDAARRRTMTAEERRTTMPNTGNEDTVFTETAEDEGGYFAISADEQAGIREQLRENQDRLNAMDIVGSVNTQEYAGLDTRTAREKLVSEMKKTGYKVDRQGFGEIRFEESEINNSLNYKEKSPAAEDARRTGFLVLKNVLKRGIEIDGHDKHKGRNYDTVTFAAPVEINGKRGNMAVVVKRTKGNRYKVHRILTPEEETFVMPEMANAEMNTVGAVTNDSQSLGGSAPAITTASTESVAENGLPVKEQFSFSEPVETTKSLIAWHNMSVESLESALELGGLAMPSFAVKPSDMGHDSYGDCSIIARKESIDPRASKDQKIYGGDAWTPVFPDVSYKPSAAAIDRIKNTVDELVGGTDIRRQLSHIGFDTDNVRDALTRNAGNITRAFGNDRALRYAYLRATGDEVALPMKEENIGQKSGHSAEIIQRIADEYGLERLRDIRMNGSTVFREDSGIANRMLEIINEYYSETFGESGLFTEMQFSDFDRITADAYRYAREGAKQTVDTNALQTMLNERVDEEGYEAWLRELFDGVVEKKGIRNDKDMFTPSGNRRSWEALHADFTLANIVKEMQKQAKQGRSQFMSGANSVKGAALKAYEDIEDVRADTDRLRHTREDAEERYEEFTDKCTEICSRMLETVKSDYVGMFEMSEALAETLAKAKTRDSIKRYMEREFGAYYNIYDGIADDVYELYQIANRLPMEYFESKLYRAYPLDEAAAIVVPDNTKPELIASLRGAGATVETYEAGNEEDRLRVVNSVEGAQFSIGGRTGAQKQEVLANLRRYMNGEMSTRDIRNYIDGLDDAGYNQPINLQTYEQSEAQEIVDAAHGQNMSVDEYLRYNWEQFERDGQMNDAAREALQLERQQSRRQYSIDEDARSTLPVNAQQYLRRAERALLEKVSTALSVPAFARREYLQDIVREISDEYLANGTVRQETIDRLFETAYEEGIVVDDEYYREYKHIKDYLRTQPITISEQDKHDIADWGAFRKSAFGTLRIVNSGGLPVDTAYQELQGMGKGLFPDDITHPADQLMRMFEVARSIEKVEKTLDEYHGRDAAEFRKWAKNDFDTVVRETMSELKAVKRYADERAQSTSQPVLTTQEDVAEAYKQLKEARRTYEKAAAKNLLTDHDNVQVGRLLKGEIELQHLNPATDNIKGITAVYEAKQEYERLTKLIREWNISRKAQLREQADEHLKTANDWKDKKAGILYSRETMERNILDIVKDKKLAQEIIDEYFAPVHKAQAEATKLKNEFRERVRKLNLSTKETKAMQKRGQVSEAHAVQLYGEAMDNIRMLENSRGRMEQRDGKTLSDWRGIVEDLWAQNPQLDRAKIENAVEEFRKIYDDLFKKMNESRLRNGYEPVNYRKGYFPHFQPGDGDGIMGLFGKALGISTDVSALPTTINGLTHTFKPGIQWFGNAQERLGFNTAYDAVEGFDRYIEGVADVIYQTDNIQRLRALATQIRYRTGDEGIRKQVDAVYADTTLSEQDKQNRIEKIFESGRYALSNFVVELEEYTNLLANKKSRADRNMEQALGRDMYNLVKALESRVAANMVAVNPASWLTNFIPLTQGGAQLHSGELLKGMWQTLQAYKESDGIEGASTFLTNRKGSDPLVRTWAQKASAVMSSPMSYIDQFTAGSLVRARYNQNLKQGLSEAEAMSEADSWAAGVMADRSKGSMPTLFNRSNPLTKVFTQFQLEVNNQLSYLFKDMPRGQREKGVAALAAALIKFFLGAWLYDEVYEYFIGRRPALDPLGILNETVGDITGYELPNLVELGVGTITGDMPSFQTEKQNAYDTATNLLTTTAEELPFIGGVLGGGRVPISSALPDWDNLLKTVTSDTWSTKKKLATAGKELLNPASYLLLPFGGGQLKKIYQGLDAVIKGGSYSVDAEGNDLLQYPVFNDNPWDTAVAAGQAMLFGKTSLETGRDWIESGFKTFGAKETAAYQAMTDAGVPDEDAYDLLLTLRGAKKTDTETEAQQERRMLQQADISGEGKSTVYYGLMATDKERELMDAMADTGADMGAVTQMLMEVKDAGDLTGAEASNAKRLALTNSALTDTEKQEAYRYLFGTKQDDGTYASSRDDDIAAFEQAGLDMDTFLQVQSQYTTINEEYGSAGEKATEFSRWVNKEDFTPEQAAVVKDCFTYYSQIPAQAARYEDFVAAGLDDDAAYELANTISALEPAEGEDSVSSEQKWRAVVDSGLTTEDQLSALESVSTESQYRKFTVAYDFGVMPEAYVTAKELMPRFDADGNGSYKNDEITAALNSIGTSNGIMLPGGDSISMTNEQKAVLWQLLTGSTSAKNNPFSTSIGWKVIDAVNAAKESTSGIVLPDGSTYTGGIVLPEA